MRSSADISVERLPVGSIGHHATGWWAMLGVIATESALFGYLLFSYFYIAAQPHTGVFPPELPRLTLALPNTIILLLSSVTVWLCERAARDGKENTELLGISATLALGIIFVIVQMFEWKNKMSSLHSSVYGSLYFTTTGFHMAHVAIGLLMLVAVLVWRLRGYFGPHRHAYVSIAAIYWHFIDAVWLCVFFTYYLVPYLSGQS
jgi:heme/copper-type cytochrome/quinol oxidase subunit 3